MDKPKIRSVEAYPVEQDGSTLICLRDPGGLAPEPMLLGMGAYFLITLFDGVNTIADIRNAFARRFGEPLPLETLKELIDALDRAFLLDSPAFAERVRTVTEEFRLSADRPAIHAGLCYAAEADAARAEIEAFFTAPGGPGAVAATHRAAALAGLIAPHIDPRRGAMAYAHAYAELRRRRKPELVIILGTSHYGAGPELFSATRKDYATPFGRLRTDRAFIDGLSAAYSNGDLFADEILHRNEHSIEFQALFLAWALGVQGYSVVPILVSSFHEMVARGTAPANDPRVSAFVGAMRKQLESERRPVLIVAGVDFAHVGRKFGDDFAADAEVVDRVGREDLGLIEHIRRGDPDGFFANIAKDGDRNKICGLAPIYTQLELLRGRGARLLKYGVALEPEAESAVTFASLAID